MTMRVITSTILRDEISNTDYTITRTIAQTVRRLCVYNEKFMAMKLIRHTYGQYIGLKNAKDIVDAIAAMEPYEYTQFLIGLKD